MKYNPKINERVAALPGFAQVHPLQPEKDLQGMLQLLYELEQLLCGITGMQAFTLQPAAGAQGEFTGLKIISAYHRSKGRSRKVILIPDSAHGTNPASAALSHFEVVQIKSGPDGLIDLDDLRAHCTDQVAALMLTNPNTLGLFEKDIEAIAALLHKHDALVYMDGANLNALLGIARPGDMGVDLIQLNLHKTFSTPHGGGGPGAGPVGVCARLEAFLPLPRVQRVKDAYAWQTQGPLSVGRLHGFYGNVGVLVRAYTYIRTLGAEGMARAGRVALINANYVKARVQDLYPVPFGTHCMHEFVATAKLLKAYGVSAGDVVKRLLDYGFYAPTVYFPLIVEEALMVEPTETESQETLDQFIAALRAIAAEAKADAERVKQAPHSLPVARVDEVRAARQPNLRWRPAAHRPTLGPPLSLSRM
jgi:glycine dehydrogenase subunit 2